MLLDDELSVGDVLMNMDINSLFAGNPQIEKIIATSGYSPSDARTAFMLLRGQAQPSGEITVTVGNSGPQDFSRRMNQAVGKRKHTLER